MEEDPLNAPICSGVPGEEHPKRSRKRRRRFSLLQQSEMDDEAVYRHLRSKRVFENVHIYFWVTKDFAWVTGNKMLAEVFGVAALVWCVVLIARESDLEEIYLQSATLIWLLGNYWWMAAEVGIFGREDVNSVQAMGVFCAAMTTLVVYYCVLRPCGYLRTDPAATRYYENLGLYPRFKCCLTNYRHYEHLHTFCWLGKDMAWNRQIGPVWILFFIFTFGIAADFVAIAIRQRDVVEAAHYVAQFFWVLANFAWGMGEIFFPLLPDDPVPLEQHDRAAMTTGRWWAQLSLLAAYVPIMLLYFVYVPYETFRGRDPFADEVIIQVNREKHARAESIDEPEHACSPTGRVRGTTDYQTLTTATATS